ncbi:hypothetical protein FBU30_008075 [Linnemannia zychae]|nr:hypothetical protein FBU30_008075 [Linnemannia zychae]
MNKSFDAGPRVRSNNYFDIGVVGRRTGITMKANVKKDADGLDNIDDFWNDEDNNDTTENNFNNSQDDISGEDDDTSQPSTLLRSDPRRYLEQEASEELLLTPTSRRYRGISKGAFSGPHLNISTDGSPSPSVDRIRKKLVFTKDSDEQTQPLQSQSNKPSSVSPALDKILSDSQERRAKLGMNTSWGSTLAPKSKTTGLAPASSSGNILKSSRTITSIAKQPSTQSSKAIPFGRRPINVPKAFDLGGDFETQECSTYSEYNNDTMANGQDGESINLQSHDILPSTVSSKTRLGREPAEFNPKSSGILMKPDSTYEGFVHEEPESHLEDDNRMRFSDEDELSRVDNEESEEEILQGSRKKPGARASKKRVASTKEPVSVSKGDKRITHGVKSTSKVKNIPKKVAPRKTVKQNQLDEGESSGAEDISSEDNREVPSMQQLQIKEKSKGGSNVPGASSKDVGSKRAKEIKTFTHEIPIVPDKIVDEETGVRRSHRTKVAPLEFWKNEKLVFEKAMDNGVVGQVIKGVIRAETEPMSKRKRKNGPRSRTKAPPTRRQKTIRNSDENEQDTAEDDNKEVYRLDSESEDQEILHSKGLREESKATAETLVYGSDKMVSQVVAESQNSIQFRRTQSGEYQLHRGLEDVDTVSGTIKIKPEGRKPTNSGNNSSMVFYVIKGLVQVNVHKSQFVLSTGGRFLVPRGNTYSIVNLSNKESTLFFVQTKPSQPSTAETNTMSSSAPSTVDSSMSAK